jgi:hypothetical protein
MNWNMKKSQTIWLTDYSRKTIIIKNESIFYLHLWINNLVNNIIMKNFTISVLIHFSGFHN